MFSSENEDRRPRAAGWPLIGRWWDDVWVAMAALFTGFIALMIGLSTGQGTDGPATWFWFIGGVVAAAALGVRAVRLAEHPTPSRGAVIDRCLSSWLTWRIVWIGALVLLALGIFLHGNKPWDPLAACDRFEIEANYTSTKCLVRVSDDLIVPYEIGTGPIFVRDSGSINEIDFEVAEPYLTPYTWAYRPVTAWLLTIIVIGCLALSLHLRAEEKRRSEAKRREASA